jgi:hypothetical protein
VRVSVVLVRVWVYLDSLVTGNGRGILIALECSSFAISDWHSVGSWTKTVHSQHAWAAAGSDHVGTAMDRAPGPSIGPVGCVEPLVLPPPSWTLPVGPSGGRRLVHLATWTLGLQWASPI